MNFRNTSAIIVSFIFLLSAATASADQAPNIRHTMRTQRELVRVSQAVTKSLDQTSPTGQVALSEPERNDVGWIVFSVVSGIAGVASIAGCGFTMLCIQGKGGKIGGLIGSLVLAGLSIGSGIGAADLHGRDNAWRP